MRERSLLMRVLFCKIHCPFICFCKPSAAHLYNPGPLKLESAQNATNTSSSVASVPCSDSASAEHSAEVKEESVDGEREPRNDVLRSCIRREANGAADSSSSSSTSTRPAVERKRVQWVDNIGRELAEIKEYESSETGDTDTEEEGRGCVCTIL